MYEWAHEFQDGQTRAVCSKCGVPYRFPDEIVRLNDGFMYCKRRCLEQTVLTRDRIQAQSRKRREMPPPKFVQAPSYADDYLGAEAHVLSAIINGLATSTDANELGWGGNYLADLILEARRPTQWIIAAKRSLAIACNRLLTLQYGAPTGPAPTVTVERVRYGGFSDGSILSSFVTAAAGLALAKGYQCLGTVTYLDAASRCAHFLRHMQCQDLDNNSQQSTFGGGAYHVGGFAQGVATSATVAWTAKYNIYDAAGLWFLDVLAGIQGGSTSYGSASSADFTASTVATLDTMIDEATVFLVVGPRDAAFGGEFKTGVSTSYPRAVYLAGPTGTSSWSLTAATAGTTPALVLRGQDIAMALRALSQVGGEDDTVNDVFDWLMTFTANTSNAAPTEDASLLVGNLKGTYDPKVAIATELDVLADDLVTAMAQEHVGAAYDWTATALLAPIASVRRPVNFAASKNTLSVPQPSSAGPVPLYKYLAVKGQSGLSLQVVP
jgi:hypothetical protein